MRATAGSRATLGEREQDAFGDVDAPGHPAVAGAGVHGPGGETGPGGTQGWRRNLRPCKVARPQVERLPHDPPPPRRPLLHRHAGVSPGERRARLRRARRQPHRRCRRPRRGCGRAREGESDLRAHEAAADDVLRGEGRTQCLRAGLQRMDRRGRHDRSGRRAALPRFHGDLGAPRSSGLLELDRRHCRTGNRARRHAARAAYGRRRRPHDPGGMPAGRRER
jgi:hypothetical protein